MTTILLTRGAGQAVATRRAALYARVSTTEQSDGTSLETQEAMARRYCVEHGWDLVEPLYVDVLSGRSERRAALRRIEEDARDRRFDVVIVYKIDRLARSVGKFYEVLASLRRGGVELVSMTEALDQTAMGQAMTGVAAVFAQLFSDQLSERMSVAHRHRAATGKASPGRTPLGYVAVAGAYVEVPAEAERVREIFRTFLGIGALRGTAAELNHRLVLGRSGLPWQVSTLRVVLRNRAYIGDTVYGKRGRRRSAEPPVVVDGTHSAIVEPEVWHEAQVVLDGRRGRPGDGRLDIRRAWSGILVCGVCGTKAAHAGGRSAKSFWRCRSRMLGGDGACANKVFISDRFLDDTLFHAIDRALAPWRLPERARRRSRPAPRRPSIIARMADLDTRRARTREMFVAGLCSLAELERRLADLDSEAERLAATIEPAAPQPIPLELFDVWRELDSPLRGRLLRALLCEVLIFPDRLEALFRPVAAVGWPDRIVVERYCLVHGRRHRGVGHRD